MTEQEVYICPKGYSLKLNADQTLSLGLCEQFQVLDSRWKWGYNIPVFGQSTAPDYIPPSQKRKGEINKDATFYKITPQQDSSKYAEPQKCTSFITNYARNAKFKLGIDENSVCQIKNHY